MNEKTPIWLQLRKEYIDDNFESLIIYLQERVAVPQKDEFYSTTIDLLRQRVEELLKESASFPVFEPVGNLQKTKFNIRLLAVFLLVETDTTLGQAAYVAFMNELRTLHPRLTGLTLKAAMNRLVNMHVASLGYTWNDLPKIGSELFAYNACSLSIFEQPLKQPLCYSKYGTAMLSKDGLFLIHEKLEKAKDLVKSGANSLDTGVGITLRTTSSEKLKQSLEDNLEEMGRYTVDFVSYQKIAQNKGAVKILKNIESGEEVFIRITAIDKNGTVHVETLNPAYNKVTCVLKWERPSLMYYYTNTLHEYFQVGDCFKATFKNGTTPAFYMDRQLVDFLVDDTKAAEEDGGSIFTCKLIDDQAKKFGWINQYGIAFYTDPDPNYRKGDFAELEIRTYGKGNMYGAIFANVYGDAREDFDEKTARHDCIRAFAESAEVPDYHVEKENNEELNPAILSLLARQLFVHQQNQLKPSDRFRLLANADVIAEMVGDEVTASYMRFESAYLRALVQFVKGEKINESKITPDPAFREAEDTLVKLSVISLLKEYGKKENSTVLAETIENFKDTLPMLARLARLIQTANSMRGTLSDASVNVIKREIIKTLSLETENAADLEADSGTYLGIESGTVEFKTSMVFPPDKDKHMQADEALQNHNVLKGVCAFLNSPVGGTLYIGVNDQGYVAGVEEDMKYLRLQTVDAYLRYIQDTIKKYLGVDSLTYIRIEPLYDNRVAAVNVESHPYRLVELSGVAYLRVNAESREMPERVREEIIARKVFKDKNRAAAISLLQHACSQRKCVILHNYASSNSGTVSERKVEPYEVKADDGLLFALDYKDNKCKVFSINRIGYVEILEKESWKPTSKHEDIKVDVFHMSGTQPIQVSLQMDLMAKNLLIEEFPAAKDSVSPHRGNDNLWYFNTEVYKLEGIGRFYIGLANHIKIIDSPELKEYVRNYVTEYLKSR